MVANTDYGTKASDNFPESFTIFPGARQYPNPGNVANLHRMARDIMPIFFDGVQISCSKGLAPNKTLFTNWILSRTYPSGFRIGGAYHWKFNGNVLETPSIVADINPSTLSSNFSVLYHPIPCIKIETKFQRLVTSQIYENLISMEYIGKSATLAINAYNADRKSGRMTLSYLRSISENLCLGSELLLEWLKDDLDARTALAVRYGKEKYVLAATVSNEALDISYWRQIHKSIQFGSSLAFNQRNEKAIGSICYQWEFKDALVRGMLDSDFAVGFMYKKTLPELACVFGLSLLFCVPNNRFAFGFTLDLDPGTKC